jgi:hypothetical protein
MVTGLTQARAFPPLAQSPRYRNGGVPVARQPGGALVFERRPSPASLLLDHRVPQSGRLVAFLLKLTAVEESRCDARTAGPHHSCSTPLPLTWTRRGLGTPSVRRLGGRAGMGAGPLRRSGRVRRCDVAERKDSHSVFVTNQVQSIGGMQCVRSCKSVGQSAWNLALVAQRIEHLTTDQKVGGSNPSQRAT